MVDRQIVLSEASKELEMMSDPVPCGGSNFFGAVPGTAVITNFEQ